MDYRKAFIDNFNELSAKRNSLQVWVDLMECMACAISNSVDKRHFEKREQAYMEAAKALDFSENISKALAIVVQALEQNPAQDFLGTVYGELGLLTSKKGQFFTPASVAQCMAGMQLADAPEKIRQKGYITINDPACGAGVTLIAAADYLRTKGVNYQTSVFFICNDIDPVVAKMCYVQLSLLGCPGYVAVADTLCDPVVGDQLMPYEKDTQDFWYTPMYFSDVWHLRRKYRALDHFLRPKIPT